MQSSDRCCAFQASTTFPSSSGSRQSVPSSPHRKLLLAEYAQTPNIHLLSTKPKRRLFECQHLAEQHVDRHSALVGSRKEWSMQMNHMSESGPKARAREPNSPRTRFEETCRRATSAPTDLAMPRPADVWEPRRHESFLLTCSEISQKVQDNVLAQEACSGSESHGLLLFCSTCEYPA